MTILEKLDWEYEELALKIAKLEDFLIITDTSDLTEQEFVQLDFMNKQLKVMKEYRVLLKRRINLLED